MNNNKLLFKILNNQVSANNLSIEHYIVRHVKKDELYKSWQMDIDGNVSDNEFKDLNDWLKDFICNSILKFKGKNNFFNLTNYNVEISEKDKIAEIDLSDDKYKILREKKNKLINCINSESSDDVINITNFQISKIYKDDLCIYVCFYGGAKKSTKQKRFFNLKGKKFHEIDDGIINIGGDFDFIIEDEKIYIKNHRNFEFAFKYTDEIEKRRDHVVEKIISLNLFDKESESIFKEKSGEYTYSRGLANIDEDTLSNIQNYYTKRCEEIAMIAKKLDSANDREKELLEKENGILIKLVDFFDFDNNKIIIKEGDNITPLIHFFEDKIMKSFLTEKVTSVLGIKIKWK